MSITQVKEEVGTMLAESSYLLASAVWPGLHYSALCTTDRPTGVCLEVVEEAVSELREVLEPQCREHGDWDPWNQSPP